MTLPLSFHVQAQSGPLAVRELLKAVMDGLKSSSLDIEEVGTIEIVLAEALNNVVEHAYPEGDSQGPIDLFAEAKADGLHFRIEDIGHPMPDGQAPIGKQAELDVEMMDLPEGGFGWFIIRDLAKDVEYTRQGNRNVLTLRVAVTANAN